MAGQGSFNLKNMKESEVGANQNESSLSE